MKAILISDHAKWCALMMNVDKTVEVRKGTALYKATQKLIDEYEFAEFYVYCTKDEELFYDPKTKKWLAMKNRRNCPRLSNGMVIFKFRCYKVEEIEDCVDVLSTKSLDCLELLQKSCLKYEELHNYLPSRDDDKARGYAIHISQLEIFDKPKELYELHKPLGSYDCNHNCGGGCNMCWCKGWETRFHFECEIQKAPQSWCYVESEQ